MAVSAGLHPGAVISNTFTCENLGTGALQTLRPLLQDRYTAYGISLFGVGNFRVGEYPGFFGAQPNYFQNANTHIMAVGAGVVVKNSRFSKMLNRQNPAPQSGGILNLIKGLAICDFGTQDDTPSSLQLQVGGPGSEACIFDGITPDPAWTSFAYNLGAGVVTTGNIQVSVQNSQFSNLKYGVVADKLTGWTSTTGNIVSTNLMNLQVSANQFSQIDSCAVYGVVYSRANVTVQQNTFTGIRSKGVCFGNVNQSKFASYLIRNDTISGAVMTAWVHLINCPRARVLANTVNFTASPPGFYAWGSTTRYGIRTEGCPQVQIIDNRVRRTNTVINGVFNNTNYLRLQGINVAACTGATVCNDTPERPGTGMRFMLNNAGIRIRLNKMFSDHTGVNL